ncbi:bifunctional 2-methylcitrate synthase/citrate synthase [Parvularcula dongshanensis]|uniref:Citrate synthase n=1 Tax=Parvularcula dongshanensis TaxID=1173995 RepID=A0A840I6M2_9PROT|nr:bifunctional 2-methylcitrate synthase/citrate synthase [Parvularcula dongshanensis]MBB4659650.1 2-methylcitrate synthase/citrate synthase II [Parvularcula dongshanensis]
MTDTNEEVRYGLAGVLADDTAVSKVVPETNSLTYRGYAVQDLATQGRFEETAYLIWNGELPTKTQLEAFEAEERAARGLSPALRGVIERYSAHAHPMDTLRTSVSFAGQEDAEANLGSGMSEAGFDAEALQRLSLRLFANIPEMIAADYRHREGKPAIAPDASLPWSENFFHMCFGEVPAPQVVEAFDVSMTLYAEHSFNASTFTARVIASTTSDLYSAVTGAIGALKGPLHGGANEAVMDMLKEVGSPDRARDWMLTALREKRKIMGFGHRVYRSGDSRVPTMTDAFKRMVDVTDTEEARTYWEMSRILDDTMVSEKGIYPNLDFPAGPAYYLMGFPIPMFTPLFVMARITGWTAHIVEQLGHNKLIRPLSHYTGSAQRAYVPMGDRG